MSQEQFENHIRRTLSGHASGMDRDAFWANLEAKRRRRRRFFLFWLPLALLAVGVGTYAWYQASASEMTGLRQPNVAEHVRSKTTPPGTISDVNASAIESAPNPEKTAPAPAAPSSFAEDVTSTVAPERARAKMRGGIQFSDPQPAANAAREKRAVADSRGERSDATKGKVPDESVAENRISPEITGSHTPVFVSVEHLRIPTFQVNNTGDTQLPMLKRMEAVAEEDNARYGRTAFTVFAEAQTGVGFAFRRFRATPGNEALLLARQNREQPLEVLTGGLSIGLQHRNGWTIRTGLEMRQFAERLNYNDTTLISYPDSNVLLRVYEYPDGSREEEYGPGTITEVGIRRVLHYNYYRFLAVPVALGYDFGGDRWSAYLEAGVSFAVWKQATGRQIGGDALEPISIAEPAGEVSYFRTRLSPEVFLGGGLRWHATDQLSLSLQPEVRYRPGNLLPDENPLDLRVGSVGLRLGVRFNLSR